MYGLNIFVLQKHVLLCYIAIPLLSLILYFAYCQLLCSYTLKQYASTNDF